MEKLLFSTLLTLAFFSYQKAPSINSFETHMAKAEVPMDVTCTSARVDVDGGSGFRMTICGISGSGPDCSECAHSCGKGGNLASGTTYTLACSSFVLTNNNGSSRNVTITTNCAPAFSYTIPANTSTLFTITENNGCCVVSAGDCSGN